MLTPSTGGTGLNLVQSRARRVKLTDPFTSAALPSDARCGMPHQPTMATIYRKTPKGHTEIETRALRLAPRLRTALILVDGRRSDAELQHMILQQPDETLRGLVEQGFIEVISITAPGAPPAAQPTTQPTTQSITQSITPPRANPVLPVVQPTPAAVARPPAAAGMSPRSFETLRASLVRSFTDSVGPMSDALAIKMERARSASELRALAETAQRIIANTRGGQAATDFGTKFIGPLAG